MTVSAPVVRQPSVVVASPKRKPHWIMTAFAIIAWQLVALCAVEGILYWAGLGEEDIFKLDKTIGFRHFPNKRVTWRSEGYSQSYFDCDGMREQGLTIAKPAGTYRIALLGDSMVEGMQVPFDQTFGNQIEAKLNQTPGRTFPKVQMLNFANSGYSTAQEYLLLKEKVFKYQPDLVILGYMSRDMFENWSPPDQTITNVRPYALHLPGQSLVIDSSPVTIWMKTPRARFLMQIEWLRHHSRIWGLISATETQLSFHDPIYRGLVSLITKPGKTLRQWQSDLKHAHFEMPSLSSLATPSFNIRFFESPGDKQNDLVQSSINKAPAQVPNLKFVMQPQLHPALHSSMHQTGAAQPSSASVPPGKTAPPADKAISAATATPADKASPATIATSQNDTGADAKAENGNKNYVRLMSHTMHSLLSEMQSECEHHGARFAVVFVPCRAHLSPTPGMETAFFNITYADEINLIKQSCEKEGIPTFDAEAAAERIEKVKRPEMFYLMHMNRKGHSFIADQMYPFVLDQVRKK